MPAAVVDPPMAPPPPPHHHHHHHPHHPHPHQYKPGPPTRPGPRANPLENGPSGHRIENGPSGHRGNPLENGPPVHRGAHQRQVVPQGPPNRGGPPYSHPGPPLPPAYPDPPRYPGPPPVPPSGEEGEGGGGSSAPGVGSFTGGGSMAAPGGVNLAQGVGSLPAGGTVTQGPAVNLEEVQSLGRGELVARVVRGEGELRDLRGTCLNHTAELRHLRHSHARLTDDNQELRDLCCFLDDDRQKGRKLAREWQRFGRYTASVMRQEVTAYQNKLRELENKQQELIKDNLELKELCLYLDEERSNAACGHCGNPLITRDDGDGSSSSTNADEPTGPPTTTTTNHHPPLTSQPSQSLHLQSQLDHNDQNNTLARSPSRERLLEDTLTRQRTPMNEQVLSYIRSLEARVMVLEAEKHQQPSKPDRAHPEGDLGGGISGQDSNPPQSSVTRHHPTIHSTQSLPSIHPSVGVAVQTTDGGGKTSARPPHPPPYSLSHHLRAVGLGLSRAPLGPGSAESDDELLDGPPPLVSRPNSVAAAMRVLEVQERLESPPQQCPAPPPPPLPPPASSASTSARVGGAEEDGGDLADGEKALLRQMCSVVWKKLEEVPGSQNR